MADKQVSFEINAGVTGRQSITGLADDLDQVSKILGDDLSKHAQAAAARLRELADQNTAINNFNRLQTGVREAERALKAAETEAAAYGKQITALGPPTTQEVAALQRLQTAADATRTTFNQQQQALAGAQGELQRYGISSQSTQAAQERIRQEVGQVRDAVQGLAPAYQTAATGAANAGGSMVRTHRAIGDGVESISQQLARLQSFYVSLQGLQGVKQLASDLAETADQVNNLQGRIKLATGEGENFTRAWQGVTEVSLRTHSALEETGTLFTRLAQAGKDAGLTTEQATAQGLALTETINQAIQLSGASAQASSAAITQLVQGLQSGVLRGDEFNSVMEQSPRLARALADGLGVTTGELRKMAEAGALTSETVIKALQGQGDAVASEFSKLPPTVGRALQDLSTQWSLYVAETDKATGASAAAATAIDAMARNLHTIAGLLMDAGQATAAFAALRLAQHFLGVSAAAQGAAVAVAASNAQMAAAGTAGATAAAGVGRFATMLASLRTFTLVGIVANFKDIGTWIGESAAKLAGYKDRTEELARAEKLHADIAKEAAADRARLAAMTQAAIEKQFELSKAARTAVAEFQKLTKEGTSAAEAVKKVTESFDVSKLQGLKDFTSTLDKLAADGRITAGEFQMAWAQALSGKDLAQFEMTARTVFGATSEAAKKAADEVQKALAEGITGKPLEELQARAAAALGAIGRDGERLAQIMDALLREAVKRTGLEYEQLQGRIGSMSRSAINDTELIIASLDKLKANGADTGRVLAASFTKAIDTADGQAAIDALRTRIESMRKVLGDKITDGLLDQVKEKADALKDALDKAMPGINSVREAMKQLGITSDETLKKTAADAKAAYDTVTASGTASARELQEGFRRAAQAAIDAANGVVPAWVSAQAGVRGFDVEVDKSGKSTLRLRDAIKDAGAASSNAARGMQQDFKGVSASIGAASRELEEFNQRMKEKYGRPGEGGPQETLGDGVQKIGGGYRNKDGMTSDKQGNAQQQFIWTRSTIIDYLRQAGLDDLLAQKLSEQFLNGQGGVNYAASAAQFQWGGKYSTLAEALGKMAEYYRYDDNGKHEAKQMLEFERGRDVNKPPTSGPAPSPAPNNNSAFTGSYVSNITINGQRTSVNFADRQSQLDGEALIRMLAEGKGVAQ